ncbi:MAG: hypothetical protein GXP26_15050 [Planctomycetes bacterium]|nr:hypothetical protein [Planctomycetota bacterium]
MASIATCPQCAKQLAVPETATAVDHAECPFCEATFLLANVVQLAVPAVRIIGMGAEAETPKSPAVEPPAAAEALKETAATSEIAAEEPALDALPSWEARLKRALESDTTEMSSGVEAVSEATETVAQEPRQIEPIDFELQAEAPLDDEPIAPELAAEQPDDFTKDVKSSDTFEKLFEADLGTPEITARVSDSPAPDAHAELAASMQSNSRQRAPRRSWIKIATLMAGTSVVGTLLGLYALLWILGPSGDLIGLANYLPESILPATSTPAPTTALAEDDTPSPPLPEPEEPETPVAEPEQLADTNPIPEAVAEPEMVADTVPAPAEPVHHDEQVQPATTEQPVAALPVAANISAEQFAGQVAAARNALPAFIEGDFSTKAATARKGRAYMMLCQLAEHFDFTHQLGLAPDAQAGVENAKALFGELFANAEAQGDLSKIASRWWEHNARSNQGICLTGYVQNTRPAGNRTLCLVVPGGQQAAQNGFPVLVDRPTVAVGSRIGVVGRIAMQGEKELVSLGIDMPQVVVSQQSYDLP